MPMMGTTYMDFSTGSFHVDGDAPLTQAQVDSVWRHLPTTGASWVERGHLFVQQFDGAKAFDLGPVERGVKGTSDKARFGWHSTHHHATKKSPAKPPTSGWLLQLKDRPYYWSRDGRWSKDIHEAKRFRLEHEAFTLSNQLHGAVVVPVEAVQGPNRTHATKKKSPAQLQREIDEALIKR